MKASKKKIQSQDAGLFLDYYLDNPIIPWGQGILLVKDASHRFIASNYNFKKFSGFTPAELIGLNDFDMPWCESGEIYVKHEQDILSGNAYSVIEPIDGLSKVNLFTQKDVIYKSNGVPAGTIATATVFNQKLEYSNLEGRASVTLTRNPAPFRNRTPA